MVKHGNTSKDSAHSSSSNTLPESTSAQTEAVAQTTTQEGGTPMLIRDDSSTQAVTAVAITERGEPMKQELYIFETLIGLGDGHTIWAQVVTNNPVSSELTLYNRLMELRESNHIVAAEQKLYKETGRGFRIKGIGENYRFMLLQDRIRRFGFDFRLEYLKLKERDEFGNVEDLIPEKKIPYIERRIMNSTRSWSTSTSTNILFVAKDGEVVSWEEFDSKIGMVTGNSRKQSKREAENSRVTMLGFEANEEEFNILIPEDEPEVEAETDGHFLISYNCFLEAVLHIPTKKGQDEVLRAYKKGEMRSFNGRIMYSGGLIKGDCHVVPNDQLIAKYGFLPDVVTYKVNIKPEKGLGFDTVSVTLTPHHLHHMPHVSSQLLSWGLDFFVTKERLEQDYTAMVNEFVTAVANGQFPKHLMKAAPLHNDDEEFNELSYISALHDSTKRWLASGMKLTHSSHLVKQHAGGFEKKAIKAITDLRIPMPWATMAHAVSVRVLEMAGWDLSNYDITKMFWHMETGRMAWPTKAFVENYNRHGGHDLDDTHSTALRILDGKIVAVNTRSPNGLSFFGENELPGEYSIVDIDLNVQLTMFGFLMLPTMNFPLYNVYGEMLTLDMDKAPQVTHFQEIDHEELPHDDYELGEKYSPKDAVRQFNLAMANPGIGQIINPLIAYSATFGTYPKHLPAYLEQMVDALEQTPDQEAFDKVMEAKAEILVAIQYHTNRMVDHYIAYKRLPKKVLNFLKINNRITKDGPYKQLVEHMKGVTAQAMEVMVGNRNPNPKLKTRGISIENRLVVEDLMSIELPIEAKKVAYELIRFFGGKRKGAPKAREDVDRSTGLRLRRNDPYMSYAVRQFFVGLNNETVAKINESEIDNDTIMIALYQVITTDKLEDDVLFQTGEAGTVEGVMDLFMKTLWKLGVIENIIDPDAMDRMGTLG